jgi:hypothetical protein
VHKNVFLYWNFILYKSIFIELRRSKSIHLFALTPLAPLFTRASGRSSALHLNAPRPTEIQTKKKTRKRYLVNVASLYVPLATVVNRARRRPSAITQTTGAMPLVRLRKASLVRLRRLRARVRACSNAPPNAARGRPLICSWSLMSAWHKMTLYTIFFMELLYVELCQHANPKQACGKLGCQRKTERLRMLVLHFG